MPRLRFRLSNLVMLLIIIALVMALVVQWRREMRWRAEVQSLRKENASLVVEKAQYGSLLDVQRVTRREISHQREMNRLLAEIDHLSDRLFDVNKSIGKSKSTEPARSGEPAK
jgi:uncharacterized membrane protein YcjF (UPF0283 family)